MNNTIQNNQSTIQAPHGQLSAFQTVLLLLPYKLLALLLLFVFSNTASAAINQFINMGGKITMSTDGCSAQNRPDLTYRSGIPQSSTCSITIKKPADATVNKVILLAAADVQQSRVPLITPITLNIKGVSFQPSLNYLTSFQTGGLTSFVRYDDITSLLEKDLNGLADGNNILQLTEAGNRSLEGMQMFVIWNDPNTVETVIGINLGTVNTYSGVNGSIQTLPINTSKPEFKVTSGTSIAYSTEITQDPDWLPQVSTLRLNGVVFADQAGGYDDGMLVNGGLFTAGGEGDSVSTNNRDELFDASSAVKNGATSLNYSTSVPSGHIYDWMVAMWIEAKGVEIVASSITGTVYLDNNSNGQQESNDSGIGGISISLYSDINNNGTLDAGDVIVKSSASDANGHYTFNIDNGEYLIQVDIADVDLPKNSLLHGSNPLHVTVNNSPVSDQDFPFTLASCTALSGNINNALSPNLQLRNNEKLFLASTTLTPKVEGHLKAYTVNKNGIVVTPNTADWDLASTMTQPRRQSKLYSTNTLGTKTLFNSLDDAAFSVNGLPSVASIKNYTLNPSFSNPLYIGNRKTNSFLGAISAKNNLALITRNMDILRYLNDSDYQDYNATVISTRTKRVLISSDDGFLYTVDQSNGGLGWGWIPRTLVKELYNYTDFPSQHFMHGAIDILDLKHSGNYASYVVGSYKSGLGQYVLKLDSSSNLDNVVWDEDHSVTSSLASNSPNNGKRVYFSDTNSKVYSTYVITNNDNTSTLYIRSLTDKSTHNTHQIVLNFTATSTPFIMPDYDKNNAPARKTLYLGDSQGNIHSAALLITGNTNKGDLKSASTIQADINKGAVTSLAATNTAPVLYMGASTSSTTSGYYLRAQSDERLTVFKYKVSDSSWTRKWTTIVSGTAGKWTNSVFSADTSIQGLPTGSHITDEAVIVANSIVLPVTHASTGNACYGTAYYYLYTLTDGSFPSKVFTNNSDSSAIEGIITVGRGEAKTLHLVDIPGQDKLLGLGISPQKTDGSAGINTVININDPVTTGIRAWREIRD